MLGGGQFMNAFIVVKVIGFDDKTGQIIVKSRKEIYDNKGVFKPYIMSYYLRPIHELLEDLELGDYLIGGGEEPEIRKQDSGLFGTIYNCSLVKKYDKKNNQWVKAE